MTNDELAKAVAEQFYLSHLLVKILRARGILEKGEPELHWSTADFQKFYQDFLNRYAGS
jgi:hypothetical protein